MLFGRRQIRQGRRDIVRGLFTVDPLRVVAGVRKVRRGRRQQRLAGQLFAAWGVRRALRP